MVTGAMAKRSSPVMVHREIVRLDRLEYLAARECGRTYQKGCSERPMSNYARHVLNTCERVAEYAHYDVEYAHGRKTPGYGMLIADSGLQSIDGEFKRFLLEGIPAYDIDQANAIPTLVLQDARTFGRELSHLEAYIADREGWLEQVVQDVEGCTRDLAKGLVLRGLFGCTIAAWCRENELNVPGESVTFERLAALNIELNRFVSWWDSSEHSAAVRAADTLTDAELIHAHTKPSFHRFAIEYQHKETLVTLAVSEALSERGLTTRVLCHDGLIVDGGLDHAGRPIDPGRDTVRSLLSACEQAVQQRTGYIVKLELKPLAPKSGMTFEQYVEQKWPPLEQPAAPLYDKKLGHDQDREFVEYLIATKHGRFFKERAVGRGTTSCGGRTMAAAGYRGGLRSVAGAPSSLAPAPTERVPRVSGAFATT